MTTTSTTPSPRALGDYDLLALIGRGGMAEVHAARLRSQPERLVALKVIRPELGREQGFVAMFLDEARIASRLSHPNIVTIYGLGHDAGAHYLVMELLRGRTLLETWNAANARGKRIPFAVTAWICARVAEALHFAHDLRDEAGSPAQVVHRDVNPSNVFLCMTGDPKVIDFGLAKARDRIAATAIGVVKGKLAYLSPEQVAGKPVDRRSDIFSLGVTLWEVTVNRRLFREDSDVATVRRVLAADVPDPLTLDPDYPPTLAAVLKRVLDPDPMRRFATGEEFARALDAFVAQAGGCTAGDVEALLADLFPPASAPPWEARVFAGFATAADQSSKYPGSVRVWDEGAQRMTWVAATAETMLGANGANGHGSPVEPVVTRSRAREIDDALAARIAALGTEGPAVGRAYLERSLAEELLGDREVAVAHAKAALLAFDSPAAHATLRRLLHARGAEVALLAHQEAELAAAVGEAERADRWAENARLALAAGNGSEIVVAAFERALQSVPAHAAALKGLEVALGREGGEAKLAAHLSRMAAAYADDAELAAWLHVERAELLEGADVLAARGALEQALVLDAKNGPVRDACIVHAAKHRAWDWLAELLEAKALLETDPARASALDLDAACIERLALGREDRAIQLLERAAARAPTAPRVDARVADDLVALYACGGTAASEARGEREIAWRRWRLGLIEEGGARAGELRTIAALEETRGNLGAAILALEEAREADSGDARAGESLDRLLAAAGRMGERLALGIEEASRARSGEERVARLLRASRLAEEQADTARAIELARSALVAKPGAQAAVDALVRLLATAPTEAQVEEARARIAVHAHAAEHAADPARRIAHLEAIALLTEEMLGDPALAVAHYEAILKLDPQRRLALLGLARAARRAGDRTRHVRALLDEAALTADAGCADALRVSAAEVLVETDEAGALERALGLTNEILARDPKNSAARQIAERIHERAGRWGLVDKSIAARIEAARDADAEEKVALLRSRAELLRTRLKDDAAALVALKEAFALKPADDELRREIVALLASRGDARALREGLVDLAGVAASSDVRIDALTRAAELDELVFANDDDAHALLERAKTLAPGDEVISARRFRIGARRGSSKRVPLTTDEIESLLAADPHAPHALREREASARRAASAPRIANALSAQADAWRSVPARIGALYGLFDLMEWRLPASDPVPVLDALLGLAPDDVAALDARVRLAMGAIGKGGDTSVHLEPLRRRAARASDPTVRSLTKLALALALDPDGGGDDASLREALGWYAQALDEDAGSIVAAHGAVRLGARFGDDVAFVAGATALADAAPAVERAVRLTQAAGKVLSSRDGRLGDPGARLERALGWLDAALEANPDCVPAIALVVGTGAEATYRDRIVATLRRALERAESLEAKVTLGVELSRIARLDPPDRVLAIEALKRVVEASPEHASSWRNLADLATEQGASADAALALEGLVAHTRAPAGRLAALFELAELHRRRPGGGADVERVLRLALDTDPTSERAARELLAVRRADAPRQEVNALLARLAEAVRSPDAKAAVLDELADAHIAAGDTASAESSLIDALATAPNAARLGRLLALYPMKPGDQARVLGAAVAKGEELGRADPSTLARLGRLEIESLGLPADGAAHLRRALAVAPTMHEVRALLARALVEVGSATEGVGMIASMMVPDPAPLLALPDPAAALATLERGFGGDGHPDEALVARELRAVAGGLDDGQHVELRARRLPPGTLEDAAAFDRATLLSTVAPPEIAGIPLAIAHALEGVEARLARTDVEQLGIAVGSPVTPGGDAPLWSPYALAARALGLEPPPFALSDFIPLPRVALVDGEVWVAAPSGLQSRSFPEQLAALLRPLVRIAIGVPWIDDLSGSDTLALLVAAARRTSRDYASDVLSPDVGDRADELAKMLARVVGALAFKQKKALAELGGRLASEPPLDGRVVGAFTTALARTELRVAFLLTGDLLATLDGLRASDANYARETERVGHRALAATLGHPLAADLVRFALTRQTTAARRRLGTVWARPRSHSG